MPDTVIWVIFFGEVIWHFKSPIALEVLSKPPLCVCVCVYNQTRIHNLDVTTTSFGYCLQTFFCDCYCNKHIIKIIIVSNNIIFKHTQRSKIPLHLIFIRQPNRKMGQISESNNIVKCIIIVVIVTKKSNSRRHILVVTCNRHNLDDPNKLACVVFFFLHIAENQ